MLSPIIAASPQVTPRSESFWDPLWQNIIDGVEGGFGDPVEFFKGFWAPGAPKPPPPETTPDPGTEPDPGKQADPGALTPSAAPAAPVDPASASMPEPSSPPSLEPQRSPTNGACDQTPNGIPDDQCTIGTRRIIFARDCQDQAGNVAVTDILAETVQFGEISTSVDDDCGILFWTGQLTEEGATTIRGIYGVLAVVNDILLTFDDTPDANSQKKNYKRHVAEKKNHLEKRDTLVTQPFEKTCPDLIFISTPPGKNSVASYSYFAAAGEGITVYVMDTGLNPSNNEFSSGVVERWMYAQGSQETESDENAFGHGSCAASKIAGVNFGVAKKVSLIVVKLGRYLSSALDGLTLILNDLRRRSKEGEYIPGYNVVNAQFGIKKTEVGKYSATIINALISIFIKTYGVIFVCAAGNSGGEIDTLPALLSPKLPIIVVGGVNLYTGQTLPYSNGGRSLTVSAPGQVICAGRENGDATQVLLGTSFAAPAVAGLVAYFLSLHDLGPILRKNTGLVPEVVKQYIVESAYVRPGGTDKAIWNKIDPDAPGPDYGWVP